MNFPPENIQLGTCIKFERQLQEQIDQSYLPLHAFPRKAHLSDLTPSPEDN